jgi:alpha-1,3-rhamnosyl/mannosyltransferase
LKTIAFGVTNLSVGLAHQGIDGIGIYCQELFNHYHELPQSFSLIPFCFGTECRDPQQIQLPSYPKHLLASYLGINRSQLNQAFRDVDLIHATDLLVPKIKGKKILATIMDVIPVSHPEFIQSKISFLKGKVWKNVTRQVDHIITCSEYSKTEIHHYFDYPLDQITVIPLGVDEDYFVRKSNEEIDHVKRQLNIPEQYFLYICTIQPRKNIVRLIEAHRLFFKDKSHMIPLVIAGKFSWDDGNMMRTIQEAQSEGRCIWVNYVSDHEKKCLLQGSLGVSFASLYEGFGLPILEALASEVPIFASKTSSIPEVGGECVHYVDPNSLESIQQGFEYLLNFKDSGNTVKRGLERAQQYSWKNTAQQTLNIYQQILDDDHLVLDKSSSEVLHK